MINLPSATNPVSQLLDTTIVLEMLASRNLSTLTQALSGAKAYFAVEPVAEAIHVVCIKASGAIVLERIGRKGGHKTLWTFVRA